MDLSAFLERQRISESGPSVLPTDDVDQDDVDHTIAHILSDTRSSGPKKGNVKQIEWDEELDEMIREKASAEATRGEGILFPNVLGAQVRDCFSFRPQIEIQSQICEATESSD